MLNYEYQNRDHPVFDRDNHKTVGSRIKEYADKELPVYGSGKLWKIN